MQHSGLDSCIVTEKIVKLSCTVTGSSLLPTWYLVLLKYYAVTFIPLQIPN